MKLSAADWGWNLPLRLRFWSHEGRSESGTAAVRILVTGATGLIGSAICARLIEDGHDLRRVSRHPPSLDGWIRLDMAKAVQPEKSCIRPPRQPT